MKRSLLAFAMTIVYLYSNSQIVLKRKAQLGFTVQKLTPGPGARVLKVVAGSPAHKNGLTVGDHILALNGVPLTDKNILMNALQRVRGGEPLKLTVLRQGSACQLAIGFTPLAAPYESYVSLTLDPVVITNDYGSSLRAFITKPKKPSTKLPAILFVSWLSCGTVEAVDEMDSWARMLRDVAVNSGCLFIRLEKPGVGDSEGAPCAETDLETELNGYQAALRYLKNRPDVDTSKIVLFGGSLGGTLTSLIGKGHNIKAYVSAVSVYKTWLEHMIELERRRLQLSGKGEAETSALMQGYIEFHTDYLSYRRTPAEVIRQKPHLGTIWYDEPAHQYGRPAIFYHQLQVLNFSKSWYEVAVPVLLIAGEYDWIMSLDDSQIIHDMLNKKSPGLCTRYIAAGMDHHWIKYKTSQEAFDEVNGAYDQQTVNYLIAWIKEQVK